MAHDPGLTSQLSGAVALQEALRFFQGDRFHSTRGIREDIVDTLVLVRQMSHVSPDYNLGLNTTCWVVPNAPSALLGFFDRHSSRFGHKGSSQVFPTRFSR
jgi:hypothetical protein